MQCLSYGTLAGKEFLHHAFYLLAEASLVEIESEYILAYYFIATFISFGQ